MQEKWHSWFDYRWGAWLFATCVACGWFRDRHDEFDAAAIHADRWLLMGILFASITPTLWSALRHDVVCTSQQIRNPRATWSKHVHALLSHSFVACILVASYGRVWNFADIGFRTESPLSWTILLGLLCYSPLNLAQTLLGKFCYPAEDSAQELFQRVWIGYFLPRGRIAQLLQVFETAVLGPIHEEIVYRGFFVYMLGNLSGYPALGVLVGLVLCITVHLYQGYWGIPYHVLFFAAVVVIMYSPAGLLTAIVMHVTNNLQHAFTLPAYAKEYLSERRQARCRKRSETNTLKQT